MSDALTRASEGSRALAWNPTAVTPGRAASAGRVRSVGARRSRVWAAAGAARRGAARRCHRRRPGRGSRCQAPGASAVRAKRCHPGGESPPGRTKGLLQGGARGEQERTARPRFSGPRWTQDAGRGARLGLAAANDPASTSPAVGPAAPGALVVVRTSIGVARAGAGPPGGAPTPLALRREVRPGARRHFLQLHGRARPGTADPKLESPSGRASGRGAGGRRARGARGVAGTVDSPVTPRGRRLRRWRWRWRWHRGAAPGAC